MLKTVIAALAILIAPQLAAVQVAQAGKTNNAGSVATVSAEAAEQTGLIRDTTVIETNGHGWKQRLATSKIAGCKSQFKLADLDRDGVLDQSEIAYYNSSIRSAKQPVLRDGGRPNQAEFIADCSSVSAHE
jgi:hypothetical protein